LEIIKGNFMPMTTHGMGLSLATAPIFNLLGSSSIFVNMVYAHFINIFISSLCIFPLYFIAKRIFITNNKNNDTRCRYLVVILFIFSFWALYSAIGFFAEPLITLLLLLMLLFTLKAADDSRWLLLSTLFAGFAYWVKPIAIIFPVIILISLFLQLYRTANWKKNFLKQALIVVIIFTVIVIPFLWQRYLYFGSPFDYGENSRYFVDSYNQLWGQKDEPVSFSQYLKTHQWPDYFQKFIFFGLGGLIFSLLAIALPFSIFSIWGMILGLRSPPLWPLLVTIIVWLIGFTPVYHILFTPRHLFPLIPLLAIFAVFAISIIANQNGDIGCPKDTRCPNFTGLTMTTVIITILFFAVSFIFPQYYFLTPRSYQELEFARWTAANLRGKLAISTMGDFVMMHLSDATVGGRGLFNVAAPQSGLELVYPGYFTDSEELKKWMIDNDVEYLALTRSNQQQRIITPPIIY